MVTNPPRKGEKQAGNKRWDTHRFSFSPGLPGVIERNRDALTVLRWRVTFPPRRRLAVWQIFLRLHPLFLRSKPDTVLAGGWCGGFSSIGREIAAIAV